tara:strand:+ start:178 stop:390 length:213 start_codon:yes stop_codon:yes gene_type:complete
MSNRPKPKNALFAHFLVFNSLVTVSRFSCSDGKPKLFGKNLFLFILLLGIRKIVSTIPATHQRKIRRILT